MCEIGEENCGGGGCQLVVGKEGGGELNTFHFMYVNFMQDRSLCLKLLEGGEGR